MMKPVRIVTQRVNGQDGIFIPANDDPNIPLIFMRRLKKGAPIKERGACPCVNKKDRPQNAIRVVCGLPDFVGWLQVNLVDRVFGICLILVMVNAGTNLYGCGASQYP